jgi:hypothetical protein
LCRRRHVSTLNIHEQRRVVDESQAKPRRSPFMQVECRQPSGSESIFLLADVDFRDRAARSPGGSSMS